MQLQYNTYFNDHHFYFTIEAKRASTLDSNEGEITDARAQIQSNSIIQKIQAMTLMNIHTLQQ